MTIRPATMGHADLAYTDWSLRLSDDYVTEHFYAGDSPTIRDPQNDSGRLQQSLISGKESHYMSYPRLFHVAIPGVVHSRAFRCIWLLEEMDVSEFEICMLVPGKPYATQMREYGVTQSHKLPTLQIDGMEVSESGVISQVLAERYEKDRSWLGTANERLEALQWIAMAETCITFRIPLIPTLMNGGKSLTEIESDVVEPMRHVFRDNVARFESHFKERGSEYLLASGFSVADTMCGWSLHTFHSWGLMDLGTGNSPRTLAYLERLRARPGFKNAEKYAEVSPGLYRRGGVAAH